jgi:ATP-dependent helicase HepA
VRLGAFVTTSVNNCGPGKLVALDGDDARVEYFDSVAQADRTVVSVPVASLIGFTAKPQTRCYWQSGGQWRVGRVIGRRGNSYIVRSPNVPDVEVSEEELFVRWHRQLSDPTDVLIVRGNESPYFHNCRQPFLASLVEQRAACRGLTSVLSSVVQLYEHQIEVVRRVLTDPIQRYLLADEVGLGKTIEAGLMIRQYLLDEPGAYVQVLAPDPLRVQWVTELRQKFLIDDFLLAKIKVMGHDDWRQWSKYGPPGMLVVDEAHHVSDPYAEDGPASGRYEHLANLAQAASRLLLLSATPLLHNESSFLGMLHLLDPELHEFREIDAFKALVAKRHELGRLFYTFRRDTPSFLLEEKTTRLRELFPEDRRLAELTDAVDAAIANDADSQVLSEVVAATRVHVSEAYRLHRRLLRTRRTEDTLDAYPVRGRKRPTRLIDEDPRRQAVNLWLDTWRDQLVFEASRRETSLQVDDAASLFWLFLEWSGSDLWQLEALARLCLDDASRTQALPGLTQPERQVVRSFQFSDEAKELLNALLAELEASAEGRRVSRAVKYLLNRPRRAKTVVFSAFPGVAKQLLSALIAAEGPTAVAAQLVEMDSAKIEEELHRFEHDAFCHVLVCDSSAEEGRNLQFADLLVHIDLPGSPNQLEQRIGRMDRYSTGAAVESTVFQDDAAIRPCYHSAWLACLVHGFGVFDESISKMQYVVDRVMREVKRRTFEDGASALMDCQDLVRSALAQEALAIAEQDALDAIQAVEGNTDLFSRLDDLENHWRSVRKAAENWISDAKGNLRFHKIEESRNGDVVQFRVTPERREPTLDNMPLVAWDMLANSFGQTVGHRGSFHREVALKNPGTRIFRIGEPFIDALAAFTKWDDRGRAFATWRCRGDWKGNPEFVALRFDYVVEGDATPVLETIRKYGSRFERSVAQRRIDACFPPVVATIWLDVALEEVTNPTLLGLLFHAYDPDKGDVNLSLPRQWVLDDVVGRDSWEPLLRQARAESQRLLEVRLDLAVAKETAREKARSQMQVTLEQLKVRSRAAELAGSPVIASGADLELESALAPAVISGVGSPVISVDSVGLVILSGRMPTGRGFEHEDEDE